MSSPWDLLDDEVQAILRPIFAQEFERRLAPYYEAEEDRQLKEEIKTLSGKFKDFGPRQQEILEFAVENKITNLDAAYHAYRGITGEQSPASGTVAPGPEDERREKRQARLEELRFKDDLSSQMERTKLQNEEEEDRDTRAAKIGRSPGDADEFRRSTIEEANQEADIENRLHTARMYFGRHDSRISGRPKGRAEKNASMDLKAEEMIRAANEGRPLPNTTRTASTRNQRDRDDGFDVRDRALLAGIRGDQASAREIAAEIESGATD